MSQEEDQTGATAGAGAGASASTSAGQDLDEQSSQFSMEYLRSLLAKMTTGEVGEEEREKPPQLLDEVSFDGVARYIKGGKCKSIIVMCGAGISTSAGIPDFRSPETGLYDNLQKFNLPDPQSIFELGFFRANPEPFFVLAKELHPRNFMPTPCHYFVRLLHDKGLLHRHYTQNIDTLERVAGLPDEKLMEAHGTFNTGHCLHCRQQYTQQWMTERIFADQIPRCTEDDCNGVVKPDIVFFGEEMPKRFFLLTKEDFPKCDLLIIMGTSLVVQPFASLLDRVPETTPRLLINKERSGQVDPMMRLFGMGGGLDFDSEDNYRDVAFVGSCDEGCFELASKLGWKEELDQLIKEEHRKLDEQNAGNKKTATNEKASKK